MKRIIVIVLLVIVTLTLTSCVNPFLPIYEMTEEDGISVIIDGVRYRQLPELKWQLNPSMGEIIGYADSWDIRISLANGDTEKNFVYLQYSGSDDYAYRLYRTDKDIPDVSVDSVDKILWEEYTKIDYEIKETYINEVYDKKIINKLFDILNQNEKIEESSPIINNSTWYDIHIILFCTDIPGASYDLYINKSGEKIVCGNYAIQYVEIPSELLEEISGKKIEGSLVQ